MYATRFSNRIPAGRRLLGVLVLILGSVLVVEAQDITEGMENLYHIRPLDYPSSLREAGVQGTISLDVVLDEKGLVTDARVVDGPNNPLRALALQMALTSHFAPPARSPQTVRLAIQYKLPMGSGPNPKGFYHPGAGRPAGLALDDVRPGILKAIQMDVSPRLTRDLERRLPAKPGQRMEKTDWAAVQKAGWAVCEHVDLKLDSAAGRGDIPEMVLRIFHPRYVPFGVPPPPLPKKH